MTEPRGGGWPPVPPSPGGFTWREAGAEEPPPPRPGRPVGRLLIAVGAVVALLAAGTAAYLLLQPRPAAPAPAPVQVQVSAGDPAPAEVRFTAAADCVSPPSEDGSGADVAYGPENIADGRPDTAWRCDGDGAGRTVRVTFDRPVRVQRISLVPGYAKTDPADGTDRYAQNRRIGEVRYDFDDGTAVRHTLDTDAANRSPQAVDVPGASTRGFTVTIVGSVPGSAVGPVPAFDKIAISELQVLAVVEG